MKKYFFLFAVVFFISLTSAYGYTSNPTSQATVNEITINQTNASEYWITSDGHLNNVGDAPHNSLGSLQGGASNEYYHLNVSVYNEIMSKIFDWLNWSTVTNGTLADNTTIATYVIAKNNSMGTYVLSKNTTMGAYVVAKNNTMGAYILSSVNRTNFSMYKWADANITGVNTSMGAYVVAKNNSMGSYVRAQDVIYNTTMSNYVQGKNNTLATWVTGNFLEDTGDTATGNYTFDSGTLFIDSTRDRIGIGTTNPQAFLDVRTTARIGSATEAIFIQDAGSYADISTWDGSGYSDLSIRTGSVGTGLYLDTSGHVGIGTTTPSENLHIYNGSADSSVGLRLQNDAKTWRIFNQGTDGDKFKISDGTTRMTIDTSGNVGINTLNPKNKLNVVGDANITGNIYQNENVVLDASDEANLNVNSSAYWDGLNSPSDISTGDLIDDNTYMKVSGDTGTGNFIFNQNVTIDSGLFFADSNNDRIGIGDSTPSVKLDVSGGARFIGATEGVEGEIVYNDAGNYYQYHNGTQWVVLTGGAVSFSGTLWNKSGNNLYYLDGGVGIGTSSPTHKFNVFASDELLANLSSSDSGARILIQDDDTFTYINSEDGVSSIGQTGSLSANNLNINGTNVGIGTTSPANPLHVVGEIRTQESGDTTNFGIITSANDLFYISSYGTAANSGGIRFRVNDATVNAMEILANGNVGIGTTSPTKKLETNGSIYVNTQGIAGAASLILKRNGAANTWTIAQGQTQTNDFEIIEGSDTRIHISSGGSVGIGTTSPSGKLHINSSSGNTNAYIDSYTDNAYLYISSNIDGVGGEESGIIFRDGSSSKWEIFKTASDDYAIYDYVRGGTSFRILDGGNMYLMEKGGSVGIGTTNPGSKLHVYDQTNSVAQRIETDKVNGYAYTRYINDVGDWYIGVDTGDRFRIGNSTVSSFIIEPYAPSDSLHITNSGNVGIGQDSPSHKLNVVGDANITGTTYLNGLNASVTGTADYVCIYRANATLFVSDGGC